MITDYMLLQMEKRRTTIFSVRNTTLSCYCYDRNCIWRHVPNDVVPYNGGSKIMTSSGLPALQGTRDTIYLIASHVGKSFFTCKHSLELSVTWRITFVGKGPQSINTNLEVPWRSSLHISFSRSIASASAATKPTKTIQTSRRIH